MSWTIEDREVSEQAFHSAVREYIICLLIFIGLYILSFLIVQSVKKKSDADDLFGGDEEDYKVYRISVWICTFSMSVSLGAVLLLPFSIVSNEVLRWYPQSYYIQWLNSSLIHSLWNYIFLLSNLCLFVLLPFAYFFIESQGFTGLKKGLMTRVYETLAVCVLLIVVIFCLAHLISIFLDEETSRKKSLLNLWNYQLPFVYSCVSLFGVAMLLTCTPLGLARIFGVVGELVVKPKLRRDIETDLLAVQLEEDTIKRQMDATAKGKNGCHLLENGAPPMHEQRLAELRLLRVDLEKQHRSYLWLQNLKFPIVMILLLVLTGISVLLVVINTLQLLIGVRNLPAFIESIELGATSTSPLGIFGASVQVTIIFYFMIASLTGFYSVPLLRRLKPKRKQTSMTKVIGNCAAVLVLSSALPVLARTLGITSFDLLGAYGSINWLRNFQLVWWYNLAFAVATGFCLVTKFTSTVRREIGKRFAEAVEPVKQLRLRYGAQYSESNSGTTPNDLNGSANVGDHNKQD